MRFIVSTGFVKFTDVVETTTATFKNGSTQVMTTFKRGNKFADQTKIQDVSPREFLQTVKPRSALAFKLVREGVARVSKDENNRLVLSLA